MPKSTDAPIPDSCGDLATLPFEKAMQELEDIVAKLEKSTISLDESVRLFERGEALRKRCDDLLKQAEARIEKITFGSDGAPAGLAPLDAG
jgi:exodeoxyribonuclease VII small subunit